MKRMLHTTKKVLVLSASPRKGGNSDLLCDQFMSGAKEAGNQAEKIFVRDKKINYCTGCGACQSNGGRCVQKDDMAEVLGKMIAADVIVMATPVYFYTMNGQMKTLIDRTCPGYTRISNKDFYFIVAAADSRKRAMERTLEGFRAFTSCLSRPKEKGVIYGTGAWKKGDTLLFLRCKNISHRSRQGFRFSITEEFALKHD
jgi:multimeric flavodoxin WrbA